MHDRPIEGKTTAQRLFLLTASLCVGAVGWFLMGEAESLDAAETTNQSIQTSLATLDGERVLATVGDVSLTESEVLDSVAGELAQLDQQRMALIARAVDAKVRQALIEQEAERRAIDPETLVAGEIERRLERISRAAVETFYLQNPQRFDQPLDAVADAIRRHLAFEGLVDELMSSHPVALAIEPSRADVTAAR